jgi:hypothetical protein
MGAIVSTPKEPSESIVAIAALVSREEVRFESFCAYPLLGS